MAGLDQVEPRSYAGGGGVAGIIKMVLALGHGVLPKTLHAEEAVAARRLVEWDGAAVERGSAVARNGHLRRAGVSSFGVSGTNAHVILEEAGPARACRRCCGGERSGRRVAGAECWSAAVCAVWQERERAGGAGARGLRGTWKRALSWRWESVAHSLATTRTQFEQRAVGDCAAGVRRCCQRCRRWRRGSPVHKPLWVAPGVVGQAGGAVHWTGQPAASNGQGAVREICSLSRSARCRVQRLCRELARPLQEIVVGGGAQRGWPRCSIGREFAQPALFALEVALYRLLSSWGIRPDMLVGHSIGEISAAHVAG